MQPTWSSGRGAQADAKANVANGVNQPREALGEHPSLTRPSRMTPTAALLLRCCHDVRTSLTAPSARRRPARATPLRPHAQWAVPPPHWV
jgi:hypothetical protein